MDVKAFERAALHKVNYQTTKAGQGFHEGRVKLLGNSAAEVGSFNPVPKHCELFKQPPEPLGDGQATSCWQERASECRVDVRAAGCRGICVGPRARAEGAPDSLQRQKWSGCTLSSQTAQLCRNHSGLLPCPHPRKWPLPAPGPPGGCTRESIINCPVFLPSRQAFKTQK